MPLLLGRGVVSIQTCLHKTPNLWKPTTRRAQFCTRMTATMKPTIRGVVFDMDGTLTIPVIDFALMKRRVLSHDPSPSDNASAIDILHHIEKWDPKLQEKAYSIIIQMEQEASEKLQIMPGALEICEMLDSKEIRRGLITRNIKESVDLFHSRFGIKEFRPALSREFRPYKPDPSPLLHICKTWAVSPDEVMMVGDSLNDDVTCGNRAGTLTCLLDVSEKYNSRISSLNPKPDFKDIDEVDESLATTPLKDEENFHEFSSYTAPIDVVPTSVDVTHIFDTNESYCFRNEDARPFCMDGGEDRHDAGNI